MTSDEIMANEILAKRFYCPTKYLLHGWFIEYQCKTWWVCLLKKIIKYFKYRKHTTLPLTPFLKISFNFSRIMAFEKQIYFCS